MLDFTKVWVLKSEYPNLHSNRNILWKEHRNNPQGLLQLSKPTYSDLNFNFNFEYYVEISGSFHNTFNALFGTGKAENWNDFHLSDLLTLCEHLSELFGLNPYRAFIRSCEIGVNITPPMNAGKLLSITQTYNHKDPKEKEYGHYKRFDLSDFDVKVYDKGKVCEREEQIFRFEIHYDKMRILNSNGIYLLADFLSSEKTAPLANKLVECIDKIQFSPEYFNFSDQKLTEKEYLNSLRDKEKMISLKTNQPKSFYRRHNWLRNKISDSPDQNIYTPLKSLAKAKWDFQCETDNATKKRLCEYLSMFPQYKEVILNVPNSATSLGKKCPKFTYPSKVENVPNSPFKYKVNLPQIEPQKKRLCLTCGRDISNQASSSKFCSAKNVGEEAAHKCRNMNSNPRNRRRYRIQRIVNIPALFDQAPYIRAEVA